MALIRYVTEMGMGADVHGRDYTKAAKRAVSDAIRHSSLNFFRALGKSPNDMKITARIGAAEPEQIDKDAVAAELPYGDVSVECVVGGLDVPAAEDPNTGQPGSDAIVIANAAIIVCFEE
ncbi:MAG: Lin0512 family protein [Pseudomonadales bacterium]|nr:Lin0512 family protein [Pseudomonadales bacterium]